MKNSVLACCLVFGFLLFGCDKNPYNQGEFLYGNFCANCHMDDGTGLETLIPPLANSDFVREHPDSLPCLIRRGIKGRLVVNGKEFNTEMAGIPLLTEFEITNVLNFINKAWGNDFNTIKHVDVRVALKACE
ncbi:MAG: cytochrome c [Saprospiraceae bacterium]|nr:MAG: cytochrome c [Saprospiraceae bacterium]